MYPPKRNLKRILTISGLVILAALALWLVPTNVLSPDGLLKKGEMYQKTGRTALALEVYKKAVEMYPNSYEAHVHLGQALLETDEAELAKQEFNKAVELSGKSKDKCKAEVAMADLLISENKLEDAEKILLTVDANKNDKVKQELADLYMLWGDKQVATDQMAAVEKYKKAYKNYDSINPQAQQKAKNKAIKIYNDNAIDLAAKKKYDKAISLLNDCLKFANNPHAHMRLAEIYIKQNKKDEAIAEYEKAYDVDSTNTSGMYLADLLVEKGVDLVKKNKYDEAKKAFEKAQEVNPSIIIPAELLYSIAISDIKTNLTSKKDSDMTYPSVSFLLKNKGKDKIDFLKVKVLFIQNGKEITKVEKILVSQQNPLGTDKSTENISITSPIGLKGLKKQDLLQAKLYLSYNSESDWKIARAFMLSSDKIKDRNANNNSESINSINDKKLLASKAPAKGSTTNTAGSLDNTTVTKATNVTHNTGVVEKPTLAPLNPVLPVNVNPQPVPVPVPVPVQPQPGKKDPELPPI